MVWSAYSASFEDTQRSGCIQPLKEMQRVEELIFNVLQASSVSTAASHSILYTHGN